MRGAGGSKVQRTRGRVWGVARAGHTWWPPPAAVTRSSDAEVLPMDARSACSCIPTTQVRNFNKTEQRSGGGRGSILLQTSTLCIVSPSFSHRGIAHSASNSSCRSPLSAGRRAAPAAKQPSPAGTARSGMRRRHALHDGEKLDGGAPVSARARSRAKSWWRVTYNWNLLGLARRRAVREIERNHPAEEREDHDQRANTCEHRVVRTRRDRAGFLV